MYSDGQIHTRAHLHLRLSCNFSSRSAILVTFSLHGCREKTQLQLVWLGHHCTEELLMGEDRCVGEKAVVYATLAPHTWQLVARLLWMAQQ